MKIDSPRNQHIRTAKSLHSPKGRRENGLYLAEGPSVVAEALMYGRGIEWMAWCEQLSDEEGDELADAARQAHIPVHELTEEAFSALSDTMSPQGIAAIMRIAPTPLQDISAGDQAIFLVLHEVRDPGNLGTMIRSADALGARAVILAGSCVDPYDPKVVRSTAGSLYHLPVVEAEWPMVVSWAADNRVKLYATELQGEHPVGKVGFPKRVAVIIGNEAHGLPEMVLQDADYTVKIPMPGRAESLNAAVAAGIMLYEAQRQLAAEQKPRK